MFKRIIFVTYINRSGSTFLVNNLSKSAEILVCPEAEILIDIFLKTPAKPFYPDNSILKKLANAIRTDHKLKYWGLRRKDIIHNITYENTYFEAFIKFIDIYRKKVKPKANTMVFKAERFIFSYTQIHPLSESFNIKFVALVRDCRAIFHSQNNTLIPGTNSIMETNSFRLAKRWNLYIKLAREYSRSSGFITLSYESLIKDFDYYLKFVCDILDIKLINPDNKGDLKFRMPAGQLVMHESMENAPETDKINLWYNKINTNRLYILELISGKILVENGYELVNAKKNFIKAFMLLIFEYLSYLLSCIYKAFKYKFSI